MEKLKFFKMQAVGNDYVFVDERKNGKLENIPKIAENVSFRRFSVGSDGLVLITESKKADCGMRIFNADGSEAGVCGNALRCVGLYLHGKKKRHAEYSVETLSGVKKLFVNGGQVTVQMGVAVFRNEYLPPCGIFVMPWKGDEFVFTSVWVGNPHAVAFVPHLDFDVLAVANELSSSGIYPQGVNVEFAIPQGNVAKMRVVERGSGETFGCGSGACAVAVAMKRHGLIKDSAQVITKGGSVSVQVLDDYEVSLTGGAHYVFKGVWEY